jgi:hypothetical protein
VTPTRYELLIERGVIYLRGYARKTQKGYFNVEAHPHVDGASLPGLRRRGAELARRHGVEFTGPRRPR